MAFKRHFSRVGSAERCTETIFTDHQRQVCDYALVYAEKKNDGEAPYSVSFTATQNGDVIVQLHPHSQLERAVRHERQEARAAVARQVGLSTVFRKTKRKTEGPQHFAFPEISRENRGNRGVWCSILETREFP